MKEMNIRLKKLLSIILGVVMLACLSLVLVACSPQGQPEEPEEPIVQGPHVCNYLPIETIQPTCTEEGYTKYKCSCGRFKNDDFVEKTDHETETFEARDNKCQVGWEAYEACKNCKYTTRVSIPAEHKWQSVKAQQADCYQKGWNNHSYCIDCGETKNKIETDYIHGDSFLVEAKRPTCLEEGYKAYYECSVCHKAIDKEIIEPLGHNILLKDEYRKPTCLEVGYNPYEYCTRCTYSTLEQNTISPLGHSLQNHSRKSPTCTENGYEAYQTCSREGCNWSSYQMIPALGHSFSAGSSGKKQCSKCDVKETTFLLVDNGSSAYRIYSNKNDTYQSKATTYLNDAMQEIYGFTFGKASTPPQFVESLKVICIGHNSFSELAGVEFKSEKANAFQIVTKGNSIFILGQGVSLKFGIYQLLNSMNGYERFSTYAPAVNEEVYYEVEDRVELAQSQIEKTVVPDIDWSVGFNAGNVNAYKYYAEDEKVAALGLSMAAMVDVALGVHNSVRVYYPIQQYYASHPEWYSGVLTSVDIDLNGVVDDYEKNKPAQVCYHALWNSQEALNVAFSVVKQYKDHRSIGFSNQDTGGFCKCSECDGDLGYEYFMFLKKLGEMMANDPETAHMKLEGMVYSENTLDPPVDNVGNARVVLGDNVVVLFALSYADFYGGLSEQDNANLQAWAKCCANTRFWLYCNKFNYNWMFFDDYTNKQKTYETLYRYGADLVEDEGIKHCPAPSNFNTLRVYLCGKLGWNTGANMSDVEAAAYYEQITANFFNNYFGPASQYMRNVFEKQKERQQYMYKNWVEGDKLFENGYAPLMDRKPSSTVAVNELGNNVYGTFSSWTYHIYIGNGNHGNRNVFQLVYSKQDYKGMLKNIENAIAAINADNSLSVERKEELIARVELEKTAVLYQFMFVYCDAFITGNNTFTSSLDASDLAAIGVDSEQAAAQHFVNLCDKFEITDANYITLDKLISLWTDNNGWSITRAK